MTVPELAERYEAVYGEPCRSRNKDWLRKKVAWRIQELVEGGLSPRAKARIDELNGEACLTWPQPSAKKAAPVAAEDAARDPRLPPQAFSVPVTGVIETDEMDLVYSAVLAGLGIGILPIYMVGEAIQNKQLVPLLRQYQVVPESAIYLVYLPNRTLSSRVRVLIDFLVARFKPIATWASPANRDTMRVK